VDDDQNHRRTLAFLTAMSQVSADLPRAAAVLANADDDAEAVGRLQDAYGLTSEQAHGVLDQQLRLFTGARRAEVEAQLRDLRDALATPWDPPLVVGASIHSPGRATVVIDGVEHPVRGQKLQDTLDRLVEVVRDQLARPHRRRVSVDVETGVNQAPTRISVDPVYSARFYYAEDEEQATQEM
jgi:hypothetical protein